MFQPSKLRTDFYFTWLQSSGTSSLIWGGKTFISWTFFTVCGNILFDVSGRYNTSNDDIKIGTPIITIGNGGHILAKGPKNGAHMQNTRDIVEAVPTAWDLKFVGYNSLVMRYTSWKARKREKIRTKNW